MMDNLTSQEREGVKAGLILAVLLIAGAGYYYFYWVKPQLQRDKEVIEKLTTETKALEKQLREMRAATENLGQLKHMEAYLSQIAAKLPSSVDAPGFYQALAKILEITRIDYSELAQQKEAARNVYTEIPYKIACRSRYHSFGQFLNLIEENPDRFMRVKSFTIENHDERPSIHPVTVEIATFMFNPS
jgi:Tfp pilus assembly protein PilO